MPDQIADENWSAGYEDGVESERERVVEWMENRANKLRNSVVGSKLQVAYKKVHQEEALLDAAHEIRDGAHTRGEAL